MQLSSSSRHSRRLFSRTKTYRTSREAVRNRIEIGGWLILAIAAGFGFAAQGSAAEPPQSSSAPEPALVPRNHAPVGHAVAGYILGPGDQISIQALHVEEITDKPVPIDMSGEIRVPVVGRIQVAGLTTAQVEVEIAKRLKSYLLHPDVSVSIAEFRSQPVSVLGAVKTPGVQQVQGGKTLFEMLSLAGGLDTNAGSVLRLTRRLEWGRIPLANATDDQTGQFSVAEVSLKSIFDAQNPAENILVRPYDVITVPRADTIYVIGEVLKSGGFVVSDMTEVTVLQALSMAGGLDKTAKPQEAKIMRRVQGKSRTEIAVNLKKILEGKAEDISMKPEDILFVPTSTSKKAGIRALEAALQAGTGVAIWRIP